MIIYKITNTITKKCYIGQTIKSLEIRWAQHLQNASKGVQLHLYEAIRSYGQEAFTIEIIDKASSIEELNKKEVYWIHFYDSLNPELGYNNIEGGQSNPMHNIQVALKHSEKMRSPEVRKKISESMKKLRAESEFSQETRNKISAKLKGNQHYKGKKRSPEAIRKTSEARYKSVYCLDKDGNLVGDFTSVKEAAEWWNKTFFNGTKRLTTLKDRIKRSGTKGIYSDNLKWFYKD